MDDQPVNAILTEAREVYGVFGKSPQALKLVDQALAAEPKNVDALNLKASILYDLDRDDEARDLHQQALTVEPHSVEAHHGLAAIANDTGKYAEAFEWTQRGFRAVPQDPYPEFRENEDYRQRLIAELYNEKAFALWYLGEQEEAARLLTEEGPEACPLEVETFEDQLEWLEHHPHSPDE
ncbi:MAG TPA: tetratricopeptide repeat protein [Armatimonadota bacterium]|jgi:tetratricopeptide (TPR) repeat protein